MSHRQPVRISDIDKFDTIVDARSPAEFALDRIPGAINCPVLSNEERAQIGTIYKQVSPFEAKRLGAAAVVDAEQRLLGIFTDGDLRRRIEAGAELRGTTAAEVMHPGGYTIGSDALAVAAAEMMETHGITSVVVLDAAQRVAGMVHIGDLMRAKVI